MDYQEFLTRIVDDAARGAREDYAKSPHKLEGSVAGLEACRGRTPAELREILDVARGATRASLSDYRDDAARANFYSGGFGQSYAPNDPDGDGVNGATTTARITQTRTNLTRTRMARATCATRSAQTR